MRSAQIMSLSIFNILHFLMALNVAQSGGRPNFLPGIIRAGVKVGPVYKGSIG